MMARYGVIGGLGCFVIMGTSGGRGHAIGVMGHANGWGGEAGPKDELGGGCGGDRGAFEGPNGAPQP